ncbi:hypothetical protein HPB48_018331 [Haemaphysalis longicornis]|uniref:MADF domain-containing protein n=1 Tax=Haemaphysalis longicornis TaxID=44386 RepID=A0A9J6FD92_HAELO|nr:hypothetical protein HPB48_018331 [Haemaphysalis longicornis]
MMIDMIKDHRLLYDKQHAQLKLKEQLKEVVLEKIGVEPGMTGAKVAKKFNNLKDTYTRVKAQLEKSNHKSGSGAKDIKKVKWRYFKQMISVMEISDQPA